MSEDRILKALQALREADEEREASPELEARLVQAFRWRRQRVWRWAGVGIAAGVVGLALVAQMHRPAERRLAVATPAPSPAPILLDGPRVEAPPAAVKPRPVLRKPRTQLR